MENKLIGLNFKGKKIKIKALVVPWWYEGIGLMFKRKEKAKALLFTSSRPKMAIHSFFVFFPFIAIWLDKSGKIVDIKRVKPFTPKVLPSVNFKYLLEIPDNQAHDEVIRFIVGERKV